METFRCTKTKYRGLAKLIALGKSQAEEYIAMLSGNPIFIEVESEASLPKQHKIIRLYDAPVAAGAGSFLDSDSYEEIEVDDTVPDSANYAVRVSGDSMEPRFMDKQIIFIKSQQVLNIGEIGIFSLNGDAYVKKLGHSEFVSINPQYKTIRLNEYDSVHVLGKVVG